MRLKFYNEKNIYKWLNQISKDLYVEKVSIIPEVLECLGGSVG